MTIALGPTAQSPFDRPILHLSIQIADFMRGLILAEAAFVIGTALWIVAVYYRAYRNAPSNKRGILPAHVTLIGAAHIMLAVEAFTFNLARLGHNPTWYIPYNTVVFTLSAWALWLIIQYERRVVRYRRRTVYTRVEDEFIQQPYDPTGTWDGAERRAHPDDTPD